MRPNLFLAAVLNFFAIMFMGIFIILMIIRSLGVGHIIRNTHIVGIIEEASVGEHSYYILEQINGMPFNNGNITHEFIESFLQAEPVTAELGKIIDNYAIAFSLGNYHHHVTQEEIVDMATNLNYEMNLFFTNNLTHEDFEALAQTLDDILDFNSLTVEYIMEDFDVDLTVPLLLISPISLMIAGVVSLLLLLLIFLQRRRKIADAILAVGIPVAVTGVITFLAGVWLGTTPSIFAGILQRFAVLLELPIQMTTRYGIIFLAVGLGIMLISFVLRAIKPKTV